MPAFWFDPIGGNEANDGSTYALRKKYVSSAPAGTTEFRLCSNKAAPINIGNVTLTYNSNAVTFTTGHGCTVGDFISVDNFVTFYRLATLTGDSGTLNSVYRDANITAAGQRFTPDTYTITTAQSRVPAAVGSGTPNARILLTCNWDSQTTQNGWCVYDGATTAGQIFDSVGTGAKPWYQLIGGGKVLMGRAVGFVLAVGSNSIVSGFSALDPASGLINGNTTGSGSGGDIEVSGCYQITGAVGLIAITFDSNGSNIHDCRLYGLSSQAFRMTFGSKALIKNCIIKRPGSGNGILSVGGIKQRFTSDNTIDPGTGTTLIAFSASAGRVSAIFDSFPIPAGITNPIYSVATNLRFSRARFKNYNAVSGDHRSYVDRMGVFLRNVGDANVSLPSGVTDIVEIHSDIENTWNITTRPSARSTFSLPAMTEDCIQLLIPWTKTLRFRSRVHSKINNLTQDQLYMEIVRGDGSTTVQSANSPLAVAASNSDWTQQIVTPDIALTAGEIICLNLIVNWYNASSWVYLAPLEYSDDGGITWIECEYGWDDGERVYRIKSQHPDIYFPAGSKVLPIANGGPLAWGPNGNDYGPGTASIEDFPTEYTAKENLRNDDPDTSKMLITYTQKVKGVNYTGLFDPNAYALVFEAARNSVLNIAKLLSGYVVLNRGVTITGELKSKKPRRDRHLLLGRTRRDI